MNFLIIIAIILTTIVLLRLFRKQIRKWAVRLRAKLRIRTLRTAIQGCDDNKAETGRKTMVVFNRHSGCYEPIEKRLMKAAAEAGKKKNNAALTKARRRGIGRTRIKKSELSVERVKQIEKHTLYATK